MQGLLAAAFLLFILFTSNPFLRLDPPPFEGAGLNPLLQDPGLAFHPPMLYTGYVGFSATFSYAAAALITGEADAAWARAARPFMLIAWIALTLGIAGGSWWAYYTLGWGGFWFWDPVENASLMPWLIGDRAAPFRARDRAHRRVPELDAAARHRRVFAEPDRHVPRALRRAVVGACLRQRSRARRVHPGHDRRRGAAARSACSPGARRSSKSGASFEPVSRETALLLNNVFLAAVTTAVFVGTLFPLVLSRAHRHAISPSVRPITRSPSRRSSWGCWCWCRSGRDWHGGAAI